MHEVGGVLDDEDVASDCRFGHPLPSNPRQLTFDGWAVLDAVLGHVRATCGT